ncbi:MAG: anti-sigma factor domain-containing protein [Clostridia bacterium]|jgi:hypothetical protein|nr:anti-sigma factor domain-containing protein [Clostridia bacterium]
MNCKGTILEIQRDAVIVLTEDCRFVHVKKYPNMFIGQQINISARKHFEKLKNKKILSALSAIVAATIFLIFFLSPANTSIDTYAYVDLDMNYSLSLIINRNGQVVSLQANDDKTAALIKDMDFKNKNINEVLLSLLEKEKKDENSDNSKVLLISTSLQSDFFQNDKEIEKEQEHLRNLMDSLKNSVTTKDSQEKTIKVIYSTAANKEIASDLRISMFRYYAYTKLKTINPSITLEEVKEKSEEELLDLLENSSLPKENTSNNEKDNTTKEETTNDNNKPKDKSSDKADHDSKDKSDSQSQDISPKPSKETERKSWQLNTNYSLGTEISFEGINYKCIHSHTSCEGWEPPVAPSLWQRILSNEEEGQWFTNVYYSLDTIVIYNKEKYKCIQAHRSHTGWEPPNASALWKKVN